MRLQAHGQAPPSRILDKEIRLPLSCPIRPTLSPHPFQITSDTYLPPEIRYESKTQPTSEENPRRSETEGKNNIDLYFTSEPWFKKGEIPWSSQKLIIKRIETRLNPFKFCNPCSRNLVVRKVNEEPSTNHKNSQQ